MSLLTRLVLLLCCVAPCATAPTANTGRFWHITDLHLDPSYHLSPDPSKVCFSSKGAQASAPGVYGDFLCDAPYRLIQSALTHMGQMVSDQDFVIWTGDSPPHVPPSELSTAVVVQVLTNLTRTVTELLPNVTVFPAIGNHDYWPQDQLPSSTNDIYRAAARLWGPWLQQGALDTLTQGGFYSQVARPGLRVVSLNTVLYYGPDRATANQSDPGGQLQWLQDTLHRAELAGEKVYIIAHVPVGYLPFTRNITAMRRSHNQRLVAIFRRYSRVIRGQFYGHTHRDSVMVLLDQDGLPVNSAFVAPAVTPIKNVQDPVSNNPGFRLYLYQANYFHVQDLWQFYLNLTEANLLQVAQWRLEYVMTEAYGLPDLGPSSLLRLGRSLGAPDSGAFRKYFAHFNVLYDPRVLCEGRCRQDQVCAVLYMDQDQYQDCIREGGA